MCEYQSDLLNEMAAKRHGERQGFVGGQSGGFEDCSRNHLALLFLEPAKPTCEFKVKSGEEQC